MGEVVFLCCEIANCLSRWFMSYIGETFGEKDLQHLRTDEMI